MKHSILITGAFIALTACTTDTTGLSPELHNEPHPDTSANAVVTVAEYADLQCPACKAAHDTVVKPLIAQYGTRIRYEFHHFPLASIHRYAVEAAEAAECSADQGKFWEFVDLDFANQQQMTRDALSDWAQDLGLDMDLFERCMDSHIKRDAIQDSYTAGRALGVTGTPTFFVNGTRVESTTSAIGAAIDEAIGTAGARL